MSETAPPSPDDLRSEPVGGTVEEAEAGAAEATDNPIINGLLSTEPEQDVTTMTHKLGLEPPLAHGLAGAKKFINGVVGGGLARGTTALEHFVMAGIGIALSGDDGDDQKKGDDLDDADSTGAIDPSNVDLSGVPPEAR